jgi:hypothetical protein
MTPEQRIAVQELIAQAKESARFIARKTGWPLNDLRLQLAAERMESTLYVSSERGAAK